MIKCTNACTLLTEKVNCDNKASSEENCKRICEAKKSFSRLMNACVAVALVGAGREHPVQNVQQFDE